MTQLKSKWEVEEFIHKKAKELRKQMRDAANNRKVTKRVTIRKPSNVVTTREKARAVIDGKKVGKFKKTVQFVNPDESFNSVAFTQLTPNSNGIEYSGDLAPSVMMIIEKYIKANMSRASDKVCFIQQYLIEKGPKTFREKGREAAIKEMAQLLKRVSFKPVDWKNLNENERRRAQLALMYLAQKKSGVHKGRMVYNGKPTRAWVTREDSSSPTATQEGMNMTCAIDANEGRDIMTADVPNAFIQALMPEQKNGEDRVIIKITGSLVDMVVDLDPSYEGYIVEEKGKRVIYVVVLRALYGMIESALLWYQQF